MPQNHLKNIRAVVFDVGNTLTTPDWNRINSAAKNIGNLNFDESEMQARLVKILAEADNDDEFLKRLAAKTVPTGWHFNKLFREMGFGEVRLSILMSILDGLHSEKHLWTKLNADVPEVFEQLKSRNIKLGVISNSEDGRVEDVLRAVEILEYLDARLDSHLVGRAKPDVRIFDHALELLKVKADEAIFIGDSFTQDFLGAERAGLKALLFDPFGIHQNRNIAKISSLSELLN